MPIAQIKSKSNQIKSYQMKSYEIIPWNLPKWASKRISQQPASNTQPSGSSKGLKLYVWLAVGCGLVVLLSCRLEFAGCKPSKTLQTSQLAEFCNNSTTADKRAARVVVFECFGLSSSKAVEFASRLCCQRVLGNLHKRPKWLACFEINCLEFYSKTLANFRSKFSKLTTKIRNLCDFSFRPS